MSEGRARCITFDLDDTLWECGSVIRAAENAFYEWLGQHLPRITARFDHNQLLAHRHAHYAQHPHNTHDITWMRKDWMRRIAADFDYGEEVVEPAFRVFWEHRNAVELFPNATEVLHRLGREYAIGAITNGNADVNYIGIGHHFDFVVTAADAGAAKPSPAIFKAALDAAGVRADGVLHVGDDPKRDIAGAVAVGMKTAWFNPEQRPWPGGQVPDVVIRELDELVEAAGRIWS